MSIRNWFAALTFAAVSAGPALAANPTPPAGEMREHREPPVTLERLAMQNVLVEQLSAQTGRPAADIAALMADHRPPEVARELGLDQDTMRKIFDASRLQVIQRAADAQLITAAQAEQLRTAPRPMHHGRHRMGDASQHDGPAPE